MTDEADRILDATISTLADGTGFGGCTSGDNLHTWDGRLSGYERILTSQIGIVAAGLGSHGIGRAA